MIHIIGGGLWGGLFAWLLHHRRPDVDFILHEKDDHLGGNHTWSFHKSDLTEEMFDLISPLVSHEWNSYEVKFPAYRKVVPLSYCSIKSTDFDRVIRAKIPESKIRLGESVSPHESDVVIDTRGKTYTSPCGYQKFVGLELKLEAPHSFKRPILMDATVSQIDGFRFMYVLPFSPMTLLIEDTRYSSSPTIDHFRMKEHILDFLHKEGLSPKMVMREETGCLPIPFSTQDRTFESHVISLHHIFHDTTGYSLPDALRIFSKLVETDLSSPSINRVLNDYVTLRKKHRDFFTFLNRLMFHAADDHERYRPLEFFYRSSPAQIKKFYSGNMNLLDKVRFFAGRPPVSVFRAMNVIREVNHE